MNEFNTGFFFGKNQKKKEKKRKKIIVKNPVPQLCASKLKGFTIINYVLQCYLIPRRHRGGGFQPTNHSARENDTHIHTYAQSPKVFPITVLQRSWQTSCSGGGEKKLNMRE